MIPVNFLLPYKVRAPSPEEIQLLEDTLIETMLFGAGWYDMVRSFLRRKRWR